MPQVPRHTSTFEQDPAPFLLKRGDILNRKHQGLVIEKQGIGADRLTDPIGIDSLLQLHIHIALSSAVCGTLFGAERFLDTGNRRVVEAHADAMRSLGVALRSQEREEGPKEGQRSGIPPGTDDGGILWRTANR